LKIRLHPIVIISSLLALIFLHMPMFAVAVFSFNASKHGFTWEGFTLDWYSKLIQNDRILECAWNTLLLAGISTIISTILGTLMAIAVARFRWPAFFRKLLDFVIYLPVVTPDIIFAAALVIIFGVLRSITAVFNPGLLTMILAHITFQIAFVALVVHGRLATIGTTIQEAARDLYADRLYIFRRVTFPLLMPGIVAGAMLAFTLSLDDFIISFFTAGPNSTTLPIYIYSSVRRGISPEIHALSTLIFVLTVLLVFVMERITRFGMEESN